MMQPGWLKARLTLVKQNSNLWSSLANSIQDVFEWRISDTEQTISNNRSLLTMSQDEIKTRQSELGHFFNVLDIVNDDAKGITLLHRLDHIHLKATDFPIQDMIKRNFSDISMDWQARYAPINQATSPYGTVFINDDEYKKLNATQQDNYFLTSRGMMVLNLNQYMPPPEEMDRIYNTIKETIIPMVPLDIVFDGFFAQVKIEATFDIHLYSSFLNPITDTFEYNQAFDSTLTYSELIVDEFFVHDEIYSVDSATKSIRLPFDDRESPLLGEMPLDSYALGAPFDIESKLISMRDTNLGLELLTGLNWLAVDGSITKDGVRVTLQKTGVKNAYAYHTISCEVGKTYFVKLTKDSIGSGEVHISINNGVGGSIEKFVEHSQFKGVYTVKFIATSITMYLVLLNKNTQCEFIDVSAKEFTV